MSVNVRFFGLSHTKRRTCGDQDTLIAGGMQLEGIEKHGLQSAVAGSSGRRNLIFRIESGRFDRTGGDTAHPSFTTEYQRAMAIRIFVTGGTFDKEYNELEGKLFFQDTHLPEMLTLGRNRVEIALRTLMMVDSLEMTDADRTLIVEQCRRSKENKIVITHGTDTMDITAHTLGKTITDKTIVITGAMVPYKFGSSDGLFNLGSALAFVQVLPPGVYIAMNGRVFHWDNVRKNKKTGVFEERPG